MNHARSIVSIVLATVLATAAHGRAQQLDVMLGVLEDIPGRSAGEANLRAVRAVFRNSGGDWLPFPGNCHDANCLKTITSQYPAELTWTIALNGRSLGQVTTRAPAEFRFYGDVGLLDISSSGRIPTVGRRSAEYSGFQGSRVYRPLIALSQAFFKDPDSWKPTRLSAAAFAVRRGQFRKQFSKVSNCKDPSENIERPWQYSDGRIKLPKAYASKRQWFLAQMFLDGYRCDGLLHAPFVDQWYVINPEGTIAFLGQEMQLVDAGDYDNDGRSEVLFSIDGYNTGGYILFYRDFMKRSVFEFSYH
jgi:hypothetical protein